MRIALVLLAVVLLATPVLGADMARGPNYVEGTYTPHQNHLDRATTLVASVIAGTFTDLGPTYAGALVAAGQSADLIYDPAGAWPPLGGYIFIVVDFSDTWWSGYWYASDEAALAAYMDGGGCLALIGQDFLYQRPGYSGWPANYFGIAGAYEDANYNDPGQLDWQGTAGGPLAGLSGSMLPCFSANPWFTDEIYPAVQGLVDWASPLYGPAQGGSVLGSHFFSTVEFGCDTAAINQVVVGFLGGCGFVPTQNTTWGGVKALFR